MISTIFPAAFQVEHNKLRQQLEEAHLAWWAEWKVNQPGFKLENIRFTHDPHWRQKFWSVQSAHDLNHWAWKATAVFWMGSGGAR